jgi:25S rRNA (adenine2142-N1)-methyltransferase
MGTTKPKSLKAGRPPTIKRPIAALSSAATQKIIVSYHQLQKSLAKAIQSNDQATIASLEAQIAALGGLKAYQTASIQGQASDRGGDSSLVLMTWLTPFKSALKGLVAEKTPFRMLEVGALSTKNACSKSGLFEIERIDLNSQSQGITQQDFMARPLPLSEGDKFDIISLSLVLNFVPDTKGRGEMLRRTTQFLRRSANVSELAAVLFLVLPASCVMNARYCSEERLTVVMASLGYVLLHRKQTAKLVYYLWQWRDRPVVEEQRFRKQKLRDGPGMNNFCVELVRP